MVTKRGLTLTALVVLLTSCASQTPQLKTYVLGYDTRTLQPEQQSVIPYSNIKPEDRVQPPIIKIGYEF